MLKAKLFGLAAAAALGLGLAAAAPADAGVHVSVGIGAPGYAWGGYGCGYYGCYRPYRPYYYSGYRPYYAAPYYGSCRDVVVVKRHWNPYWGRWQSVRTVRRSCY